MSGRYITLAPVAGVVGLAFNLTDPNNLLKGNGDEGITIALLERDHPKLEMGNRHDPLTAAFMNGTIRGTDVFIPMDLVLGGQERCGFGWNMLMDCLAEGRSISLPSSAVGASKYITNVVGGYSRIRTQFKTPIAEMGGVQEHLSRIGYNTYLISSGSSLLNGMVNNHEQPAVLGATLKLEATRRGRQVVMDGMDILGGCGVMRGEKKNSVGDMWMNAPIGITVEGANTLTRCLIVFGQGLTRSHPHLYSLIQTLQEGKEDKAAFSKEVGNMVTHAMRTTTSSFFKGVGAMFTGFSSPPTFLSNKNKAHSLNQSPQNVDAFISHYEGELERYSSVFAAFSTMALSLGGRLKTEEMISGRFADIFGSIFLGYAALWNLKRHQSAGNMNSEGMSQIGIAAEVSVRSLLAEIEGHFGTLFANFPISLVGTSGKLLFFPSGFNQSGPSDQLVATLGRLVSSPTQLRDFLSDGIYIPHHDKEEQITMINDILPDVMEAHVLIKNQRKGGVTLSNEEQLFLNRVMGVVDEIVQVSEVEHLGHEQVETDKDPNWVRPGMINDQIEQEQKKQQVA